MSRTYLDLSGSSDQRTATALVERLANLLKLDLGGVVLASSPADALRACAAAGVDIADDRTLMGVVGLDAPIAAGAATLLRVGPEQAPLSVIIIANPASRDSVRKALSRPAGLLLEAGLDALRPAARLKARADRDTRGDLLDRAADQLERVAEVRSVQVGPEGLVLEVEPGAELELVDQVGLQGRTDTGRVSYDVADAATARALVDWLGAADNARTATIRRTTKETDIALSVDLDGEGVSADTGVHFFDHMLDQIGRHGGIGLRVVCEGDVEVDAHHTIEDVCLALGEALRDALGDKRGIARFGFETPMDETRASVWIDLSGRPYARFDGAIPGERVGDFPVEMCAHAFRSLAESLRAAIHVKVDGENAHHMVESCFKSFGRALRMAKTIEGDALPSTKGVL